MDKFWLKSYPQGVPAEVDFSKYHSLAQLMEESLKKFASRPAFVCMDKSITYAELDAMSLKIAAWLQSKGIKKGARIAIMMPNILQYPVVMLGVIRAGYTVVNVNPLYTPRELEHQLKDSGAEAIFILENFATTLEQVIAHTPVKHVVVACMGDLLGTVKGTIVNLVVRHVKKMVPAFSLPGSISFNSVLSSAARLSQNPVEFSMDDLAFLQYTGGTTGVSKGAMLTQRNIVANVIQADAWFQPALSKQPDSHQLTMVCALPLYHIFALTVCGLVGMRLGALNILIPNPRDMPGFIKELGKYKVDMFPAVNTLYNGLMNNSEFAKLDFSNLKLSMGGGMAMQKAVTERWKKITGSTICEGYGLSETSPIASAHPLDGTGVAGSIGLPLPSTELKILDDNGDEVPLGQPGEIGIRGPQVMAGYWNNPAETAKVMTADGFFKTGDIGVMDETGCTKIVDRKKDMILVSGFNVYPNEIEGVVAMHPGVLEVACVGVPDEHSGEAVKLYIVKKDPALTVQDILEYCKHELTGYKKPRHIEFRTELPKTNVGKILRRELRDEKKAA
ncbi:long-chain-fatty-acid--CoA ligase [Solimicrobium silvestre]|uniref:Long-chain-fatty-acid--CoA ligase n=1 Tax=Solimicrobium silvestre TaxID=2099400 RepID=A0A2S9GV81_9BURK|nr:long-chain-fatty-acid--CoA ligase [Solimicrobium silvestre]PRC91629.1 Acyl-CoA synthetases (AMP-forming)/AMP-acid ligases II [Solimicrobium silvestre]